jgi:hypothetical protein
LRYINEFKLHHDPRVIRIIGPAYFLALDTCKLSVQDPGGWTATCAGGAAYTEEWMNNFNAHDPRRTLCSDEEPNATEKSNTKAAGRAVHAARQKLAAAQMAQAATTTGLEGREKMKALQRAAKAALQHLHSHTTIKDLPISQDLKPMMEHCIKIGEPALVAVPSRKALHLPCPRISGKGRECSATGEAPRPSMTKAT